MNRMNNFLLMGSVALSGIVAFSACSSENDMGAEVNPTFDGKTVKTQFALNVPYGNTGTRMSADAAQQNSNFRGISNMKLLSFTATPAAGTIPTSLIDLSTASESDGNAGRYIYSDVAIPVGTKNFIFYGKATGTETATTTPDKLFENGYLSNNLTGATVANLDKINFGLEKINRSLDLTNATAETAESYGKVLKALQDVTETEVTEGATTIKWNDITTSTTDAKLDQAKNLWNAFKTLKAGSANSVRITLEHLKTTAGVTALAEGETPTADGDGLLKTLVKNIDAALTTLGTGNFPADLNLPDGAVGVKYDEASNKWSFNSSVTMNENTIDYKKITYPASLDYFVSTPAKARDVASTGLNDAIWPTKENWTKDEASIWTDWDNEVKRTSRTIALEKAIQYGVANLQLTINAAANTLEDNAMDKGGRASNQNVFVTGNKLVMTGVLIGGQPTQVEWNYEPKTGTTFDLTIYDKKMNGATAPAEGINVPVKPTASTPNYTLVLDNNNATTKPIYVAVELVNNTGIDFYGADGMVPAGGKFYLIGKLNPEAATGVTGKDDNVNRVFLKDYTTKANLTIKDLKNAYNVIPDLRSTAISVGLAVNLEWQNGITFDVEI
ncbi:hypothetical protein [Prevotella sp.]|uniref:hypothetical protein n=1 Tax=Prevotella sp. TaxID=59823 RepID=UPI00307DA1BF